MCEWKLSTHKNLTLLPWLGDVVGELQALALYEDSVEFEKEPDNRKTNVIRERMNEIEKLIEQTSEIKSNWKK